MNRWNAGTIEIGMVCLANAPVKMSQGVQVGVVEADPLVIHLNDELAVHEAVDVAVELVRARLARRREREGLIRACGVVEAGAVVGRHGVFDAVLVHDCDRRPRFHRLRGEARVVDRDVAGAARRARVAALVGALAAADETTLFISKSGETAPLRFRRHLTKRISQLFTAFRFGKSVSRRTRGIRAVERASVVEIGNRTICG